VIKRPEEGQVIKSDELGFSGKVLQVHSHADCFIGMQASQMEKENEMLHKQLGDDFRELYFEVTIEVISTDPESEYAGENLVILTWDEFQSCTII